MRVFPRQVFPKHARGPTCFGRWSGRRKGVSDEEVQHLETFPSTPPPWPSSAGVLVQLRTSGCLSPAEFYISLIVVVCGKLAS